MEMRQASSKTINIDLIGTGYMDILLFRLN